MRALFVLLACLAVLSSCGATSRPPAAEAWTTESELVTAIGSDPDTIDPQRASFLSEASVIGLVFEPLLTYDPGTLSLIPAAARSLPDVSPDGRVYTYRLRPGLVYSDGAPLTAWHFASAFARLCDPRTRSDMAFVAFPIAGCGAWNEIDLWRATADELAAAEAKLGVRALDAETLQFTLAEPAAHFPQVTALWVGAPLRATAVEPATWPAPAPRENVGNGPFRLVEWKRGERMVFERNERYRAPVRLRRWTKVVMVDSASSRRAYDEGRLDAVAVTPADDADRDALLMRPDLARTLGQCTSYVGLNTARPPFDDPLVRLAFAKAIDKEEYARVIDRTGRAAASLVPHGQPGHAHDDRIQGFDPAEARRLLAASRYGSAQALPGVAFTYGASVRNTPRVQWLLSQWYASLGIQVRADPVQTTAYGSALFKRPDITPQLSLMGWCGDFPDGDEWYGALFRTNGASSGRTHFGDPAFDALLRQADGERDVLARQRTYERASAMLSRSAPGAWLTWSETWWLVGAHVKGVELSTFDHDFAQLSAGRIYRTGPGP
ncbi:MAG TPA: peptide ABC transporter substrate-binding protein [Candidatus Limnocylindria bacterium]|nr:peptide ABC transporter substrate-binding protein [Candidatus Limnocylindria bacterium]